MAMARYACLMLNVELLDDLLECMLWALKQTYREVEIEVTEQIVSADIVKIKKMFYDRSVSEARRVMTENITMLDQTPAIKMTKKK